MSGQLSIQGNLTGLPTGSKTIGPLTIPPSASNDYEEYAVTLGNGFNAIAVPAWAAGVIIVPNAQNAVSMTLKGSTGDTGTPLSPTSPTEIAFPTSPPAFLGVTLGAAGTTVTTFVFF